MAMMYTSEGWVEFELPPFLDLDEICRNAANRTRKKNGCGRKRIKIKQTIRIDTNSSIVLRCCFLSEQEY